MLLPVTTGDNGEAEELKVKTYRLVEKLDENFMVQVE